MYYLNRKYYQSNDRRINRTHKALCNSLNTLLETKEFSSISIQDIADQADIAKATFYRYYPDKYALLEEIIDTLLADFYNSVQLLQIQSFSADFLNKLQIFIDKLKKYRQISSPYIKVDQLIKKWLEKYLFELLQDKQQLSTNSLKITTRILAACILEMIDIYSEQKMPLTAHNINKQTQELVDIINLVNQRN